MLVSGNLPAGTTGRWVTQAQGLQIESPGMPTTLVRATQSGVYTLRWILSAPGCPDYSAQTVTLEILAPPFAKDDGPVEITGRTTVTVPIMANDEFNGAATVTILQAPVNGTASITPLNEISYTSESGERDSLVYMLCSAECNLCDTATVFFHNSSDPCDLDAAPDNLFPEGITPNGDGYNEALSFTIIDKTTCPFNHGRSEIIIFNRWGDRVFEASPYNNNWKGETLRGGQLPSGVYYYVLKVRLDRREWVKFGNVTIFR